MQPDNEFKAEDIPPISPYPNPGNQPSGQHTGDMQQQLTSEARDEIEEECIQKARQVIARTGSNPFKQLKEIAKIKANYLKKRYNKDLKVSEE